MSCIRVKWFTILTCLYLSKIDSARILGVFPTPSISHQYVFRAYSQELAKRGHEVVIITPDPADPMENHANVTQIDTSFSYAVINQFMETNKQVAKRGVVSDIDVFATTAIYEWILYITSQQFTHPEVKQLLADKTQHFDLIVVEALMNYHLIVTHFFKAPVIAFSSLFGFPETYHIMGGPSIHPVLYPHGFRSKFRNLNYWEQLMEVYNEYRLMNSVMQVEEMETNLLKQNYGPDAPSVDELKQSVEMLFLNSHALFGDNRPVPPSVVYLGSIHLRPAKDISQELKTYLDNSKRGVVYVSLGTNVKLSHMDDDLFKSFVEAFAGLPYDILWKFDGDNLEGISDNVKIQKWFPQRDLLLHPNIKVFVTQCGLQSTDEAIDAAVPLVGIPILADQWFNANKYVQFGIGVEVDILTMQAKDLIDAVNTVIGNDRENIKRLRSVMRDQPDTPMDRAMWWTEHVLRHGGAKHLRAPTANISWSEYYMLDVLAPLLLAIFTIILIGVVIIFKIFQSINRLICKSCIMNKKIKIN